MSVPRNREDRVHAAILASLLFALSSCGTAPPGVGPPPPPVEVPPTARGPESDAMTAEEARAELRRALEAWVEAIRAGDADAVRALVATEEDLRTFMDDARVQIITGTRPDRSPLVDRLVNSARDQPIEILQYRPGKGTVLPPGERRAQGPFASFETCELRLSYGGLVVDLELLHPMRFPSGWRVLEIRQPSGETR